MAVKPAPSPLFRGGSKERRGRLQDSRAAPSLRLAASEDVVWRSTSQMQLAGSAMNVVSRPETLRRDGRQHKSNK